MKYAFFVLITAVSVCSCNHKNQEDKNIISQDGGDTTIVDDSWNYPERLWRLDSLGCMGIRRKGDIYIEGIVEHYSLWNKSSAEFCKIFGKPNKRKIYAEEPNIEYLIYYLEARCNGDTVDDEADKAYVIFEFVNDSLLEKTIDGFIE